MFKTKEIRWFFKKENIHAREWFDNRDFNTLEIREDIYLMQKSKSIGIKLRNGNVEIKHCTGIRARGCLTAKVWGNFDEYIKWSFPSDNDSSLYSAILQGSYKQWITVKKRRRSVKINLQNEDTVFLPIQEQLKTGCQIEYTELEIKGEKWNTFGVEWFGLNYLEISPKIVTNILGNSELNLNMSKSYITFLSKFIQKEEHIAL